MCFVLGTIGIIYMSLTSCLRLKLRGLKLANTDNRRRRRLPRRLHQLQIFVGTHMGLQDGQWAVLTHAQQMKRKSSALVQKHRGSTTFYSQYTMKNITGATHQIQFWTHFWL